MRLPLFPVPEIAGEFAANKEIVLHLGDAVEFLRRLPDESIKLIITSPPLQHRQSL